MKFVYFQDFYMKIFGKYQLWKKIFDIIKNNQKMKKLQIS